MAEALLHPSSRRALDDFAKDLPQSLLLSGPVGIGLTGAMEYLAAKVRLKPQVVLPEKDEKVDLEKGTITIDIIRRLYDQTKTKSTEPRLIVIDYAERMAIPAQNAFLKLLEEPNASTYFILLTHQPSKLLPTIHSRVHGLELRPIDQKASEELLDTLGVTAVRKRVQLLFIASGLPAELTRLVGDESAFESRSQIVRDARTLLQATAYEKLKTIEAYRDKRPESLQLLLDAARLIEQNIQAGHGELVKKLEGVLESYDRISGNGVIRLWLARAVL